MKKLISFITVIAYLFLIGVPTMTVSAANNTATANPTWNYWAENTSVPPQLALQHYKGTDSTLEAADFPLVLDYAWFTANNAKGWNIATPTYSAFDFLKIAAPDYRINTIRSFDKRGTPASITLTSVEIPYSLNVIGGYCFRDQTSLTEMYLPDSITHIQVQAFAGCAGVDNFVMSENLAVIDGGSNFTGVKSGANFYFRGATPPSTVGDILTANATINVYYPAGSETAYKAMSWGSKTYNITYIEYTELPEAAEIYYAGEGTGNGSGGTTPTPTPSGDPTEEPTQEPTEEPTPTPDPFDEPIPVNDVTYQPLGIGSSFQLYPANFESVSLVGNELNRFQLTSDGSVSPKGGSGFAKGPFRLSNIANYMNKENGYVYLDVAADSQVGPTRNGSTEGTYNIRIQGGTGTSGTYVPFKGRLQGVETNVKIPLMYAGSGSSNKGLDALVTYNGGQTAMVNVIPDGAHGNASRSKANIDIGTYENLESVKLTLRGATTTWMPTVQFTVVNENPGSPAPATPHPYRKYTAPIVTPEAPAVETPVVLPAPSASSPIKINEVCAGNSLFTDAYGLYSDWIELYNTSSEPVDISGYGIVDSATKAFSGQWKFPAGAIVPANGYLAVFASNQIEEKDGEYHADFAISKNGEVIALSNANGDLIDIINIPGVPDDQSYGYATDGSGAYAIMETSFEAPNGNVLKIDVPKPMFSADSGFYGSAFDVTITAPPGTTVYYTLDGSKPTISNPLSVTPFIDGIDPKIKDTPETPTAHYLSHMYPVSVTSPYTGPIAVTNRTSEPNVLSMLKLYKDDNIGAQDNPFVLPQGLVDKITVVRAIAIDAQGNESAPVTKSYFVGYDLKDDFANAAILSVSTDAGNLYDQEHGIFTHYKGEGKAWEREANLTMFEGNGKKVIDQDVGIRIKGTGSSDNDQRALNFYARSEYGASKFAHELFPGSTNEFNGKVIKEYDNFSIRTGSQREKNLRYMDGAMQYLASPLGLPWQRARLCSVFIDGEYWGTYYMQERVHEAYIENHYGVDKDDVHIKKQHEDAEPGMPVDIYNQAWLENTDFSDPQNYALLEQGFDIPNLLMYYGANLAMNNLDWGNVNYAQWRSITTSDAPFHDGKWRMMMYDCDMAYDNENGAGTDNAINHSASKALLSNPSLRKLYLNTMCDTFYNTYSIPKIQSELKYWYDEFSRLIDNQRERWPLKSEAYAQALDNFYFKISARPEYFYESLKTGRYSEAALGLGTDAKYPTLRVKVSDPATGSVKVNLMTPDFNYGSYTSRYFNSISQTLEAIPAPGYEFTGWVTNDGTMLSSLTDITTEVTIPETGSTVIATFARSGAAYYEISTVQDLIDLSNKVNNNVDNGKWSVMEYRLTNDIVFDEVLDVTTENFTPIGTEIYPFNGIFDGQGFTISRINTYNEVQGNGLFGYLASDGVVKMVGVIDSRITAVSKGKNVGMIVGNNAGLIENCYSTGYAFGASTTGGISGNNNGGVVKNCYSLAEVVSTSAKTGGGISGKCEGETARTINSYSLVNPVGNVEKGGAVDELSAIKTMTEFQDGTVTTLLNTEATVWEQGASYPVLIQESGAIKIATVQDLINFYTNVNGTDDSYATASYELAADIILDPSTVNNYVPAGTKTKPFNGVFDGKGYVISGINLSIDGLQGQGLIGYLGADGIVKNVGVINCSIIIPNTTGKNIGAIAGNNSGLVENCYSTGIIYGESTTGGITGNNNGGVLKNCYSLAGVSVVSGKTAGGISGKCEGETARTINSYSLMTPVGTVEKGGEVDALSSIKPLDDFVTGAVTALLNTDGIIWHQGFSMPLLKAISGVEATSISYDDGSITIENAAHLYKSMAIISSYNGLTLVDVATKEVTVNAEGNAIIDVDEGFTAGTDGKIKIMLLGNMTEIRPACESIEVTK